MNISDIVRIRLYNQQISVSKFNKSEEVVAWLGGIQGQDFIGAKWSMGLRLPSATDSDIEETIADRKIIRTWLMRGTLHFAAASDARWMLNLLAPGNIAGSARRHKQLELDESIFIQCKDILIDALRGGRQLTREDLYKRLENAGICMTSQRHYHILWRLAQDKIICFVGQHGKQQTFALFEEWVPDAPQKDRSEALIELAKRYFSSRGPVTLQDYIWWSGLTAADARSGLEMIKSQLEQVTISGKTYWFTPNISLPENDFNIAHALPGFDEYLLGYKDRSIVLDNVYADKVCPGGNGVFSSTIAVNGKIVGTWQRTIKKNTIIITAKPFTAWHENDELLFRNAVMRYTDFLGIPAVFS